MQENQFNRGVEVQKRLTYLKDFISAHEAGANEGREFKIPMGRKNTAHEGFWYSHPTDEYIMIIQEESEIILQRVINKMKKEVRALEREFEKL